MMAKHARALLAALTLTAPAGAQTAPPTGDISPVHDPVLMRAGRDWYVFSTGIGRDGPGILAARTSADLATWRAGTPPFEKLPDWAVQAIPGAKNLWAPDITYVNGRYRLYYSVSTFGSNRSAIGLATSITLDPTASGYGWRDEGMVLRSLPDNDFNAIDPAFVVDAAGRHWLSFGSFWSGLKLVELNPTTGKPLRPDATPLSIARRPVPAGAPSIIEAPYIFARGGWYWLIASYDYCCKGVNSTYYTVIGRAKKITGPYLGKDGSSMLAGGGTILLRADLEEKGRFRGPGHAGHYRGADGVDRLVYHAYDKENAGAPTLRVATLRWGGDGWPTAR